MSIATEPLAESLVADPVLLKAIVGAVESCLTMCDTKARCVGVSSVPVRDPGRITGLIGIHGGVSGFVNVNMPDPVAAALVGGLLQERFESVTPQVVDGVGEVTNIITGGIKKGLGGSPWAFSHFTVPSVIIGRNYQIAYARGVQFISAAFEHQNEAILMLDDRLFQVTLSLMKL